MPTPPLLKAGAVVVRRVGTALECLLLHRGNHHDWSFPKGHLEPNETLEDCARREGWEETGLHLRTVTELPTNIYENPQGQAVGCAMYLMEPEDPAAKERAEHAWDRLEWVPWEAVANRLTHENLKTFARDIDATVRAAFPAGPDR